MKKLMIAVAVAGSLFATVRANTDAVQSQNVVGYKTVNLDVNVQVINGASFVSVGKDALSIQDIKMNAGLNDGEAQIWWWNGLKYDDMAYWYTDLYKDESGNTTYGYAGWGDGLYWMPVEKDFAPGESFWIQVSDGVSSEYANYTMAGEVESVSSAEQYYTIPLEINKQEQFSNPFPTGELDIQNIKMSSALNDGEAQIWWWNGSKYDEMAYWYTDLYKDEAGIETLGYAGWGDGLYWMPTQKTFADGEGFWIQISEGVAAENGFVKFPNPLYVAP